MVTYLHTKIEFKYQGQLIKWFESCGSETLNDVDPMTLILKLDLNMVVTYLQGKIAVNRSKGSKVVA